MAGPDAPFTFALYSLAVWRITHMLVMEAGPWLAFDRLRERLRGTWIAGLFDCFYCMSIWIAAPAALLAAPCLRATPLWWLALAAAACLLERSTSGKRQIVAEPAYIDSSEAELPAASAAAGP